MMALVGFGGSDYSRMFRFVRFGGVVISAFNSAPPAQLHGRVRLRQRYATLP